MHLDHCAFSEVAEIALLLASGAGSFVTGEIIRVDGGEMMCDSAVFNPQESRIAN